MVTKTRVLIKFTSSLIRSSVIHYLLLYTETLYNVISHVIRKGTK